MIDKKQVETIVQACAADLPGLFVVGISVSPAGKIVILADTLTGITIEECVSLSRAVESALDRDVCDFALEVSSPGLTEPFAVPRQYQKNVGREVRVVLTDGALLTGVLQSAEIGNGIVLDTGKGKRTVSFNEIKTTQVLLKF